MDLPDYYGESTDALGDCLTDMSGDPSCTEIPGFENVRCRYKNEWDRIIEIFRKAKHAFHDRYADSFLVFLLPPDGSREEIL